MCIKLFSEYSKPSLLFALLSVSLLGCSSDGEERPEYMNANTVRGLEIPPKLTSPDTRGALQIPEPSQNNRLSKDKSGKSHTIAPVFSGYELKQDSRLYWLEIDMPVAKVWSMLPDFLASEGITVDRVEKLLGFIDTSWMNEYQISYSSGEGSSWFSSFSPDYKDRFRIRLEAIQGKNKTRLFVSHRGLQINVVGDDSNWVQRDSEPLLEREIMYRFVLFAGIRKSSAKELLTAYTSYQPRVKNITDTTTDEFDVKGDAKSIWLRLQLAMDRLGVDVLKSDRASNTMIVRVGSLQEIEKPPGDDSGWFSGLFGGKDIKVDEDEDYEDSSEYKEQPVKVADEDRLTLRLEQIVGKDSSKIKISHEDGTAISENLAWLFRDALLRQLK